MNVDWKGHPYKSTVEVVEKIKCCGPSKIGY